MITEITYVGDGVQTDFNIPFQHAGPDVQVDVDDVTVSATIVGISTIQVTPAPADGAAVRVYRNTNIDERVVDFSDGAVLTEEDLDKSSIQAFFKLQELVSDLESFKTRAVVARTPGEDLSIPSASERADKFLGFDAVADMTALSAEDAAAIVDPYITKVPGPTGPVANTYFDLTTFQEQDVSNGSATLNLNGVRTDYARSFDDESANPLAIESTSTPGVWWVPKLDTILDVKMFGADPSDPVATLAALNAAGAYGGQFIITEAYEIAGTMNVTAASTWYFGPGGSLTQTAPNTALVKHADGIGATWHKPKLRGYGATDTASIDNNDIFTSAGQAIGLWFRQARFCNVIDPDISGFRNAAIARQYCSDSYVTGVLKIRGTLPDAPLSDHVPVTGVQQFGIIDHANAWVEEGASVNYQNSGTPHGNRNVGVVASGGSIEDTAIAYCCFPGFTNVRAEGYKTANLTQHAGYVYAYDGAVFSNIHAKAGSSGVKFSLSSTASGRNPTGCKAINITAEGGSANAVVFETFETMPMDAIGTPVADNRAFNRFHFVAPVVENIQLIDWEGPALVAMHCRNMSVKNITSPAITGETVPQALWFSNCSGTVDGIALSNTPNRAILAHPRMFETLKFGSNNKIHEVALSGGTPVIEAVEASDVFTWYARAEPLFFPENFVFRTGAGRYYRVISEGLCDPVTEPTSTSVAIPHGTMMLKYLGVAAQKGKGGRVLMGNSFDIDLGLSSSPNRLLYVGSGNDNLIVDWFGNVVRSKAGVGLPAVELVSGIRGEYEEIIEIDVAGKEVAANEQTFFDQVVTPALKVGDEIISVYLSPAADVIIPSATVKNAGDLRVVLWNFHTSLYTFPAGYKLKLRIRRKAT